MRYLAVLLILTLGGCSTITLWCPDGKSEVTYRGTNVLSSAATTASCGTVNGVQSASLSGVDLAALAALVAPLVMAHQAPTPAPQATPTPPPNTLYYPTNPPMGGPAVIF